MNRTFKKGLQSLVGSSDNATCVIAVPQAVTQTSTSVRALLKQASEVRHPGALVLYAIPGGWELIENAIESVNAEHERLERGTEWYQKDHFEIWDPVLVLGERLDVGWVGATKGQRKVLRALLDGPVSMATLSEILPDQRERQVVLRDFPRGRVGTLETPPEAVRSYPKAKCPTCRCRVVV